jgi:hypothetical protein
MHRSISFTLLFCWMALSLAACRGQVSTPQNTLAPVPRTELPSTLLPVASQPAPQETPAPEQTPTQAQPQAESPSQDLYQLTAVLNYTQHLLVVDEKIHYTNRQTEALPDLSLMIDPLYFPGAFTLKNISWGEDQTIKDYTIETGQIQVNLPAPLQPGESLDLYINYELSLPSPQPSAEVRPVPFGYTARQSNFVDWYPFIPPYLPGEGWLAHRAGFFGEHLVYETADFEVSIRLSEDTPNIIIAASAPAARDGEWYHYQHKAARNFAWSASTEYQVSTTTVGETTIQSYAFPFHAAAGQAVLQTTAEALALYNELYGTYPRGLLSVVEADFLDGMEYDGLYFLSNGFYNLYQGNPGEYLVAIAAHETAHQWFYAMVGNDQALEPWLDEALCTYQERIYYERLHPEALDWWWAYRVNYYAPRGWVDSSIYNPEGYRSYRDAVYLNGALFLEELRSQIGDTAFFLFFSDYTSQLKGTISTADQFFSILETHTQEDLSELVSKYFQLR